MKYKRGKSLALKKYMNDPSAGSPTETLLRLLLPLSDKVRISSHRGQSVNAPIAAVPKPHRITQSVGATGGVYKGQGRIQRGLMTHAYKVFLVQEGKLQASIPSTSGSGDWETLSRILTRWSAQCSARAAPDI